MKKIIKVDDFEIELTLKKIKNINLRVFPHSGAIKVSAPIGISDERIQKFIKLKKDLILKYVERTRTITLKQKEFYVDQESLFFKGKEYKLRIFSNNFFSKINLTDSEIQVFIPKNLQKKDIDKFINDWYRIHLKVRGEELISKWEKIIGVSSNEFRIKKMKTRWGTCNYSVKRIWLSLELMKKPDECLEYVVVHELVHLLEASHNARFKALMTKFLPNWKILKAKLNGKI
jgi:predicted metal-dependent hydrolase